MRDADGCRLWHISVRREGKAGLVAPSSGTSHSLRRLTGVEHTRSAHPHSPQRLMYSPPAKSGRPKDRRLGGAGVVRMETALHFDCESKCSLAPSLSHNMLCWSRQKHMHMRWSVWQYHRTLRWLRDRRRFRAVVARPGQAQAGLNRLYSNSFQPPTTPQCPSRGGCKKHHEGSPSRVARLLLLCSRRRGASHTKL